MDEADLFTVKVFQVRNRDRANDEQNDEAQLDFNKEDLIQTHPNMISARVIKGRMIELEHSKLVGEAVKFKTVVNFEHILPPGDSLGVILAPQDGYVMKPELNHTVKE